MIKRHETAIRILEEAKKDPLISIDQELDLDDTINMLKDPGPAKITRAWYEKNVDPQTEYTALNVILEDASEFGGESHRKFHFHANNPMPKESDIIGMTWQELVHTVNGMFHCAVGDVMTKKPHPHISPDKRHITLPVPIGGTLYRIAYQCEDQCRTYKELFNALYPPTKSGRCGTLPVCYTRINAVLPYTVTLNNIEFTLENFGTRLFLTEHEAWKHANEFIRKNNEFWQKILDENKGYIIIDFDGTGILEIEKDDSKDIFETDDEAAEQAKTDGIPLIPENELPKGLKRIHAGYIDTEPNRERILEYVKHTQKE